MKSVLIASICSMAAAAAVAADWSDDFDSYAPGGLHGFGGWAGWNNDQQFDALVTDTISCSSSNSVKILPTTDIVHEFTETSGTWLVTAVQYIPSGGSGDQFFIMHSSYTPGGPFTCAHDIIFHQDSNTLEFAQTGTLVPIIHDQWVEIRVEIDLDGNTQEAFYNGVSLGSAQWVSGGPKEIATIDLFSWAASPVYYDDMEMVQTSGALDQLSWGCIKGTI
jgi:hypothetical protein